ncbi:TetR/AcrR family transcriptional regulator [Novosphingobium sediminicola]|uniref:AcrR family transcriptional regulator n=1 Tax=Novosphingobium sediminicola TaxID=563162 RepID=A0A7W6CLM7_9SPHN|nr:TetR/AcrR family transcriptional regulator [Novosphingobium sediminicola]MBB3953737.1 AcrR family transcriptional regulator [Novosphingobium sediminicola]
MTQQPRTRRSQEERTAETREALIDAAIATIHEQGYTAASTTLIAERAGVSRGAILHQFGTRAALMSEVVAEVYRREMAIYTRLVTQEQQGQNIYDWPRILMEVLGMPSGIAVLEILLASQSDKDLTETVRNRQAEVEEAALATMRADLGGKAESALAVKRLMVWAVRGISIANRIIPGGIDTAAPIGLLSELLKLAAPGGQVDELEELIARGKE